MRVDVDPGVALPMHSHHGEETVYVLEGTWEFQLEGKGVQTLKAGDVAFVPAGAKHQAKNVSSGKGAVLATYIVEKGKPLVIPPNERTLAAIAAYPDAASAEVVAGLLRSEGVPVNVASDEPMPGLIQGFRLMVPAEMLHRARWVVANADFTDEELAFLATDRLDSDGSAEEP